MNEIEKKHSIFHKLRFVQYLLPFIIIGFALHVFLPRITTLEDSIKVLQSMSVLIVGLAVISECCSYLGSGYLLKVIVSLGKSKFSVFRGALITLAAASIGLVMGGWVSIAVTTYHWVSKSEDIAEESKLTGFLPALYNNSVLIALTSIGLLYLLIIHDLSKAQMIAYSLVLFIFGLGISTAVYGILHRDKVEHLILGVANFVMRILRRSYEPTSIRGLIDGVYAGLALLSKKGWIKPAAGSCMSIGFDMLTLYFIFIAAGHPINPLVLLAGYGVAFFLGAMAFFIPGGLGVVESGMVAVYTSLNIPANVCLVTVLIYRFLSFWLPSVLGFAANVYLKKITEKG